MITPKLLRLSIDALANSLKIDKKVAQFHFAKSVGNQPWAGVQSGVERGNHTLCQLNNSDVRETMLTQMAYYFAEEFNIPIGISMELITSIEPFSGGKPKSYRIDKDVMNDGEGKINMSALFEGMGGDEGMFEAMKQMFSGSPELMELLEECGDAETFQNRMRISMPLDPSRYYNALAALTDWDLNDEQYDEEYEPFSPSFHIDIESMGKTVPVYLFSHVATPGDSMDKLNDDVMEDVSNSVNSAIVLFKHPQTKTMGDKDFCTIGMQMHDGKWSHLLLCEATLEEQHNDLRIEGNFDLESPVPAEKYSVTEKYDHPSDFLYFVFMVSEGEGGLLELPHKPSVITSAGGWRQFIL